MFIYTILIYKNLLSHLQVLHNTPSLGFRFLRFDFTTRFFCCSWFWSTLPPLRRRICRARQSVVGEKDSQGRTKRTGGLSRHPYSLGAHYIWKSHLRSSSLAAREACERRDICASKSLASLSEASMYRNDGDSWAFATVSPHKMCERGQPRGVFHWRVRWKGAVLRHSAMSYNAPCMCAGGWLCASCHVPSQTDASDDRCSALLKLALRRCSAAGFVSSPNQRRYNNIPVSHGKVLLVHSWFTHSFSNCTRCFCSVAVLFSFLSVRLPASADAHNQICCNTLEN